LNTGEEAEEGGKKELTMTRHSDGKIDINAERMGDGGVDEEGILGFAEEIFLQFVPDEDEDETGDEDGQDPSSTGALFVVGQGLWERIEFPDRWEIHYRSWFFFLHLFP
jgi:hypothetical protein